MSEQPPQGAEQPGKFNRPRDAVLHHMTVEGWANVSSGDVASPTGWFARISNEHGEIDLLTENFIDQLLEHGAQPEELVGHYLLVENDQGSVAVTEYADEAGLDLAFMHLDDQYTAWVAEGSV